MSTLYLKIAAPILCLFVIVAGVIRAQPYDDQDVRQILMPDECAMPCFIGIRPGVTRPLEAVRILEASSWITDLKVNESSPGVMQSAQWKWSGKQPDIFPAGSSSWIIFSLNDEGSPYIDKITLNTSIPIGYAYLLMGQPNAIQSWQVNPPSGVLVGALYANRFLTLSSVIPCEITKRTFWEAPMAIDFFNKNIGHHEQDFLGTRLNC